MKVTGAQALFKALEGEGVDAILFRSYLSAFGDPGSRATSHLGFGMNASARMDYLELYDKSDVNGTEARTDLLVRAFQVCHADFEWTRRHSDSSFQVSHMAKPLYGG